MQRVATILLLALLHAAAAGAGAVGASTAILGPELALRVSAGANAAAHGPRRLLQAPPGPKHASGPAGGAGGARVDIGGAGASAALAAQLANPLVNEVRANWPASVAARCVALGDAPLERPAPGREGLHTDTPACVRWARAASLFTRRASAHTARAPRGRASPVASAPQNRPNPQIVIAAGARLLMRPSLFRDDAGEPEQPGAGGGGGVRQPVVVARNVVVRGAAPGLGAETPMIDWCANFDWGAGRADTPSATPAPRAPRPGMTPCARALRL